MVTHFFYGTSRSKVTRLLPFLSVALKIMKKFDLFLFFLYFFFFFFFRILLLLLAHLWTIHYLVTKNLCAGIWEVFDAEILSKFLLQSDMIVLVVDQQDSFQLGMTYNGICSPKRQTSRGN